MNRKHGVFLGILIGVFLLFYVINIELERDEAIEKANFYKDQYLLIEQEKSQLNRTLQLHYLEYYNKKYNSSYRTVATAYCYKDIILIDIKDREYWQALESFNHEWQHCKWGEHYRNQE